MLDSPPTWAVNVREPFTLYGRWAGAGASVPTPVANTTRPTGPGAPQGAPIAIARSGVGALTVTIPNPVGTIQNYSFGVASAAADKNVRTAPPAAGSGAFALQITFHANGVAVDLAVGEELLMEITSSTAVRP